MCSLGVYCLVLALWMGPPIHTAYDKIAVPTGIGTAIFSIFITFSMSDLQS